MILHRRREEMPVDEWEHRLRQPMHFGGPASIRPYFDPEWLRQGGMTEVFSAITYSQATLPSLPRITTGDLNYNNFMSQRTFWHRCHSVRRQMTSYLKHPLLLQFAALTDRKHCAGKKALLDLWKARLAIAQGSPEQPSLPPASALLGNMAFVLSNGGSSFGAVILSPLLFRGCG
jgi:hypothetical protein